MEEKKNSPLLEYVSQENFAGVTRVAIPETPYALIIQEYRTLPKFRNMTKCQIYNREERRLVAEVCRNHPHFWFHYMLWDGYPFLLCGTDYRGYGAVNLKTGNSNFYSIDHADILCWAKVSPGPEKNRLLVDGCVWGGFYEVATYEFQHPMLLPYRQIHREYKVDDPVVKKKDDIEYVDIDTPTQEI